MNIEFDDSIMDRQDSPVASTSSNQEATEGTTRMTDKLLENLVMLKANKDLLSA